MDKSLWSILVGVICLNYGGCIYGVGGKASVDAFSVSDSYSCRNSKGYVDEPTPQQLSPLKSVVVVTYYEHLWGERAWDGSKYEFVDAKRIDGGNGQINYPPRLFPIFPFTIFQNVCYVFAGAVVFSEDCWPATFNMNYSGGPSAASDTASHIYPTAKGYAFRLHPVLFRHTRSFGKDIFNASGVLWLVQGNLDGLIEVVEHSKNLSQRDRQLVYSQLLEVVRETAQGKSEEAQTVQYEQACKLLREKLLVLKASGV